MNNKKRNQTKTEIKYSKILISIADKKIIIEKKYKLKTNNIKNIELKKDWRHIFKSFLTIISAILIFYFKKILQ